MRYSPKTILPRARALLLASALFGVGRSTVFAQAPTTNQPWAYLLVHDSYLLDDCQFCDRISIPVPMRGTFNLRLVKQNTLSSRYAIEDINFMAGDRPYGVTGSGTVEIGGERAGPVPVSLRFQNDDVLTHHGSYFTNSTSCL